MRALTFLMLFFLSFSVFSQKAVKKSPLKLPADSIVSILYAVLENYSGDSNLNLPEFQEASIELETNLEGTASAGIEIEVFEVGAETTLSKSCKTTYGIVSAARAREKMIASITQYKSMESLDYFGQLDKKRKERQQLNFKKVDLSSELLKMIDKAASDYANMIKRDTNKYRMDSFEIELSFGIRYTADGKLNFSLFGVGGNIGGEYAKEKVHTITVKYGSDD